MANIFKTKPFLDQCSGWLWSSSWKLVWEVLWRSLPGCVEQQRGDLEEVPLIQWHASVLRTVLGLLWGHHDRWVGGVKIVTVFMNTGLDLSGWWLQEWEDMVYLCGMWSHTHTPQRCACPRPECKFSLINILSVILHLTCWGSAVTAAAAETFHSFCTHGITLPQTLSLTHMTAQIWAPNNKSILVVKVLGLTFLSCLLLLSQIQPHTCCFHSFMRKEINFVEVGLQQGVLDSLGVHQVLQGDRY